MILIAFTDMNTSAVVSGSVLIEWVKFQNFFDLFGGDAGNEIAREIGQNFGRVLTWTFEWALIATFTCYFGGIFLALLINRKDVKLKKLWRTVFILTIAIPQFITLLIMRNLLIESGPINTMLLKLHILKEPINFLQQGSGADASLKGIWIARGSVLLVNLYIGIPYTMLMTSGILMNIPSDLYEAATIDGANKWQMFRKITLPYVIFVTTPYLIQSFIGNITSFNTIFLLTGGGPTVAGSGHIAGHTDLLVTWLYKMTIDNYKYNAGSIIGILTFMITASITLICYRNSKAYKEEDTFQ
jgi:arabinogalactan oligomer/maltooligosaccharide transport system permease protein